MEAVVEVSGTGCRPPHRPQAALANRWCVRRCVRMLWRRRATSGGGSRPNAAPIPKKFPNRHGVALKSVTARCLTLSKDGAGDGNQTRMLRRTINNLETIPGCVQLACDPLLDCGSLCQRETTLLADRMLDARVARPDVLRQRSRARDRGRSLQTRLGTTKWHAQEAPAHATQRASSQVLRPRSNFCRRQIDGRPTVATLMRTAAADRRAGRLAHGPIRTVWPIAEALWFPRIVQLRNRRQIAKRQSYVAQGRRSCKWVNPSQVRMSRNTPTGTAWTRPDAR
jgi:hypothetical protein